MVSRGLFIGRFQPPHLGHLEVIKHVLSKHEEIIIVIAAAQMSHTLKNPLTAGERITLMRMVLRNNAINPDSYWIIPATDLNDNALWVHHIKRLVPKFDIFYSNNPYTQVLFKEANFKVANTSIFDRSELEGSKIRNAILNDDNVDKLLDNEVQEYLKQIDLKGRLEATIDLTKREQRGSEINSNR